jgi:hypothetical protein
MVGEAFNLLGYMVPGECLERLDDLSMEYPTPVQEETAVGYLLREGMLEGVGEIGEQTRLVQELGILEMRQAPMESLSGQLRHSLEQGEGHLHANDRCGLEQALRLGYSNFTTQEQDQS